MKKLLIILGAAMLLDGCATTPLPTAQQLETMDCGPIPRNYEQSIKDFMQGELKDPDSAEYKFIPPVKQALQQLWKSYIGWEVGVQVNAKNSYGGYTGYQPYFFFFQNEKIVGVAEPPYGVWNVFPDAIPMAPSKK